MDANECLADGWGVGRGLDPKVRSDAGPCRSVNHTANLRTSSGGKGTRTITIAAPAESSSNYEPPDSPESQQSQRVGTKQVQRFIAMDDCVVGEDASTARPYVSLRTGRVAPATFSGSVGTALRGLDGPRALPELALMDRRLVIAASWVRRLQPTIRSIRCKSAGGLTRSPSERTRTPRLPDPHGSGSGCARAGVE